MNFYNSFTWTWPFLTSVAKMSYIQYIKIFEHPMSYRYGQF